MLKRKQKRREKYERLALLFKEYSKLEAKSIGNIRVKVNWNIGLFEDLRLLDAYGCDGIGLFRVEFMYIRRKRLLWKRNYWSFFFLTRS
ncbi:MAG: putative PEP-binding protein [Desulfurococcaceae archaeon]